MPDPIVSSKAQVITRQVQSAGLSALLKSGPMLGTVQSAQAGKVQIAFQGRSFTLDVPQSDLKPGQTVTARESGGKVLLEAQPMPSQTAPQAKAGQAAASRSLPQALSQMGLSGPQAETVAKALLQAGVPLDPKAMKTLLEHLPNLSPQNQAALQFLLGRGLPVSMPMVAMLTRLLAERARPGPALDRVFSKLKDLLEKLEERGDEEGAAELRQALGEIRRRMKQPVRALRSAMEKGDEKELRRLVEEALASPEARIQSGKAAETAGLGDTVVKLLSRLMEANAILTGSPEEALLHSLIDETALLHESLSSQALENLPSQTETLAPVVLLQIPFRDGETSRELEIRYRPREGKPEAGSVDLRLELTQLGPLLLNMAWNPPQISVGFTVQNEDAKNRVEPYLPDLQQALQDKGFHVSSLGVRVGEVPDTLRPPGEPPDAPPVRRLDLRG